MAIDRLRQVAHDVLERFAKRMSGPNRLEVRKAGIPDNVRMYTEGDLEDFVRAVDEAYGEKVTLRVQACETDTDKKQGCPFFRKGGGSWPDECTNERQPFIKPATMPGYNSVPDDCPLRKHTVRLEVV